MNFLDMRRRAQYLGQQGEWAEVNPAPDWGELINRGVADFSWDAEYFEDSTTITTVNNQAIYTVDTSIPPRYYKTIKIAAYTSISNAASVRLEKTTEMDENLRNPIWFTNPAGTPSRWLVPRPNTIQLVDPPSVSGDTITIRGVRADVPLVSDIDTVNVPDTYHEAIPLRAAILHMEGYLELTDTMAAKLNLYREQYSGFVKALRLYMGLERYGVLRRQVRRGYRGRVGLIGYGNY